MMLPRRRNTPLQQLQRALACGPFIEATPPELSSAGLIRYEVCENWRRYPRHDLILRAGKKTVTAVIQDFDTPTLLRLTAILHELWGYGPWPLQVEVLYTRPRTREVVLRTRADTLDLTSVA